MPRFRYSFIRPNGAITRATADAENEFVLAARLQAERAYLLKVGPERSWLTSISEWRLNTWRSSLVLALHELGSLLKAGLPVDRALAAVAELLPEPGLRDSLLRVRDAVRRGITLAEALEAETVYFSPFLVNLIRAGEVGGTLDVTLVRLAEHLRKQSALRDKLQLSLIYPAILVLVGLSALVLLAVVVLPQLAPIFTDAGEQLPLSTRLLLNVSSCCRRFGWLIAILLLSMTMLTRQAFTDPSRRRGLHKLTLKLPVVGPIVLATQTARFARTAGTLLGAGVDLSSAIGLARQTLTNVAMAEALLVATADVRRGLSLTDALQKSGLFPKLSLQLVSVGEETGHLDEMLVHQAELFERIGAQRTETLVAILVPSLTILIGTTVAGVLASILLAVMKLNDLAS